MPQTQWWQVAHATVTALTALTTAWLAWSKIRTERVLLHPVFELQLNPSVAGAFDLELTVRNRGHDRLDVKCLQIVRPVGAIIPAREGFAHPIGINGKPDISGLMDILSVDPSATRQWRSLITATSGEFREVRVELEYVRRAKPTKRERLTLKAQASPPAAPRFRVWTT
jgi:hypothetical protein